MKFDEWYASSYRYAGSTDPRPEWAISLAKIAWHAGFEEGKFFRCVDAMTEVKEKLKEDYPTTDTDEPTHTSGLIGQIRETIDSALKDFWYGKDRGLI